MRFSWPRGCMPLRTLGVLVVCGVGLLLGCQDNITTQDEVFRDARERVEANVLPPVVAEAAAVLRNLVHLLAVLPEICATRLAELGTFESSLPTLDRPDTITFNNTDSRWELTWQNRVLGDDDTQLIDTTTPRVDITLTVRFRSQGLQTLRAIPFVLAPQTALQTAGEPPSFAAGTTEGFFLFQDAASGLWTLRWRSLGTPKVFEGRINATALTRVVRRIADGANNAVTSLVVSEGANELSFQETTAVADQKGLTFFARPGDMVRFRLRIGANANALQSITREQLRIGDGNQSLPDNLSPADVSLASNLPIDPTGTPIFTRGTDLGTFVWQDVGNNTCNAGEDQWRLRFSKQDSPTTFSGIVRGLDEPNRVRLRTTAVGACPVGRLDDVDRRFVYDCPLSDNTDSGYDICVTADQRLDFTPEVTRAQDPRFVFVGAMEEAPPSPDPFTILFDLGLTERQSSRNVRFSRGNVVLRGNNETKDAPRLNPDQASLDPLCSPPGAPGQLPVVQPKVRLTGRGDYATTRFEGGAYVLETVEFTNDNVDSLTDFRRFPDRGNILLQTRVEAEDATVTAPTEEIVNRNGQATTTVDVELRVNGVLFTFPNREVGLTVE